jgi:hypothetical protein
MSDPVPYTLGKGVRRFLAGRADAKARDIHLPAPVFDPPVAGLP